MSYHHAAFRVGCALSTCWLKVCSKAHKWHINIVCECGNELDRETDCVRFEDACSEGIRWIEENVAGVEWVIRVPSSIWYEKVKC